MSRNNTQSQKQSYKDEETLRRLYHERDLNQTEMGEELDTTAATVSYWMNKLGVDTTHTSHTVTEFGEMSNEEHENCIYYEACGNETPGGNNLICDNCLSLVRKRSRDGRSVPVDEVGAGNLLEHMEFLHMEAAT